MSEASLPRSSPRTSGHPWDALLWTGVGFVGLCLNNVVLIIDRLVLPDIDLTVARTLPIVLGMAVMVFGLIWEEK